jgi:uncharacterized protein YndB with AHSA1/START domain
MAASKLDGMRVAILVADGFEQVELIEPRKALNKVGAETKVISPAKKKVWSWDFTDWGKKISVDVPASPKQVYRALSDMTAKARWFEGREGYVVLEREMDVRPGGRERLKGRWTSGMVSTFDAVYFDVVPNERLVYTYEMRLDDRKISVSLATMELMPVGDGTRLVITEQGAFLDGYDDAGSRERGTGFLLDRLGASLQG